MIRRIVLGLLLLLPACNRSGVADVTLDADAAQRNATAAKTRGDLAAADDASRGPPPVVHDAEPVNVQQEAANAHTEESETEEPADNEADRADRPTGNDADADIEPN